MRRLIYLDSLVVRRLVLVDLHYSSIQRQNLINFYKENFGISCHLIKCPYLFLEFIGVTKEKLGINNNPSFSIEEKLNHNSITDFQVDEIDKILVKELKKITNHVTARIIKSRKIIKERLKATTDRFQRDAFSHKIIDKCFHEYIWLFKNGFQEFVRVFAKALSWDVFVTFQSNNLKFLRERQLGYWHQNYNDTYPFGKIADDLISYFKHDFPKSNFMLKTREDMVDSKMMTLAVTGNTYNGNIRRVDTVTFDTNVTDERLKLALGIISSIEKSLDITIPKKFGHTYCLTETAHPDNPFNVEIIQNQNIILL